MHTRSLLTATLAALLLLTHTACALEPTKYDVPMQDGTALVTDVYLPDGDGPYPVLLARSTYGRGQSNSFTKSGYAVVIQDVRGMGDSPGEKYVFNADGWRPGLQDGADTVAWIKKQPWCNGKIGTWGGSALGITQQLLAPTTHDLEAQYIEVAPSNLYPQVAYRGGVWSKNLLEGWLTGIQQPHVVPYYKEHPRDDEFWSYYNFEAKAPEITAPALFVGGWFDIFNQGEIDSFVSREQNGGPGAKGANYLIMKWSPHGPDTTPDYKHNENRFDLKVSKIRDKFFDYHLKGNKEALRDVPKVHYYVMGDDAPGAPGNEWRTADTWPPYPTEDTAYHLRADGTLGQDAGDPGHRDFTFEPKDPVMTIGGQNLLLPAGPYDQRKVSVRPDVLKYESPALTAPLEITGHVTVKLRVSSDAPDTDFTAKLVDTFPDGREILLLDNIRRVKSRDGLDKVAPLLSGPDQIVDLEIDLWSIAWIFNTGHKIGLHISSSNYPRFEVNANTGEDFPGPPDTQRTAHNQVHGGTLQLPIRK